MKFINLEDQNHNSNQKNHTEQKGNSSQHAHSGRKRRSGDSADSAGASMRSMIFSLILVVIAVAFAYGFKGLLLRFGQKPVDAESTESTSDTYKADKEYLQLDSRFQAAYIMIQNLPQTGGFYADFVPGKQDTESVELKNGQIYYAEKYGTYNGKNYYRVTDELYHTADDLYIEADDNKVAVLKDYTELTGSINITLISTTGVRERYWADFEADNVAKKVYVGNTIDIIGKVTTQSGSTAFLTKDGYYITTNTKYLNDNTRVVGATTAVKNETVTSESSKTGTTAAKGSDTTLAKGADTKASSAGNSETGSQEATATTAAKNSKTN